ncbi:MAG: DUF485 domain-containing protein [Proteobacteria bacterium]|nr:DUF485 domain-containing protein [Pseudomonadota bacterium]
MDHLYARIFADAEFQALQRRRQRFAWLLSALVFAGFLVFILLVAFAPHWLALPMADGSVISRGVPLGSATIVFGFILTGLFVRRANGEFDRDMARIIARCHEQA